MSEKIWMERVTAWRASGQSASAYCVGQPFAESALRYWWRRLRESGEFAVEGAPLSRDVRLARVEVAKLTPAPRESAPPSDRPGRSGIVVEVGAVRIAVDCAFDRATLGAVVEVVVAVAAAEARP